MAAFSADGAPLVVVAPDRHGRGTNALLCAPPGLIEYQFGEDSFAQHCAQAAGRRRPAGDLLHSRPGPRSRCAGGPGGVARRLRPASCIPREKAMTASRVALYLQDTHDLRDGLEYVRYAERLGFEAVWQAESRLVRDAIVPMAAYAAVTERLKVGSGVINNWTRNIGLLAATFLTLDDLAPNRMLCGIGAWWDPLARNVGIERRKPLQAMRETIEVLRRLLRMERVTFHGEFHHVDGIELDVVHGRREPRNVPIYIGATGLKMMELTGEIADGVVLNYCVPPEYNDEALAVPGGRRAAGRTQAGRPRPAAVDRVLGRSRPGEGAGQHAAAAHPVPGAAAAHRPGQRRGARGRRPDPVDPRLAGDPRADPARQAPRAATS